MGEAAARARSDPTFGRIPKNLREKPRGIVIGPGITIKDDSLQLSMLDLQELRASLLFFDELALPENQIFRYELPPEIDFLESAGILKKIIYPSDGGTLDEIAGKSHVSVFQMLDRTQPGKWSMATGEHSFRWDKLEEGTHDGYHLDLIRSIPVPTKDVPLQEILEFKHRRHAEILALRAELDAFGFKVKASGDPIAELQSCSLHIQNACADLISSGKEWKFPIIVSDAKCSFEINSGQLSGGAVAGMLAGQHFSMPTVGALIGGAAALIKITGNFKIQKVSPRSSPYEYVYNFHDEVF